MGSQGSSYLDPADAARPQGGRPCPAGAVPPLRRPRPNTGGQLQGEERGEGGLGTLPVPLLVGEIVSLLKVKVKTGFNIAFPSYIKLSVRLGAQGRIRLYVFSFILQFIQKCMLL